MSEDKKLLEKYELQMNAMIIAFTMLHAKQNRKETEDMLRSVVESCDKHGYGSELPRMALNRLLPESEWV